MRQKGKKGSQTSQTNMSNNMDEESAAGNSMIAAALSMENIDGEPQKEEVKKELAQEETKQVDEPSVGVTQASQQQEAEEEVKVEAQEVKSGVAAQPLAPKEDTLKEIMDQITKPDEEVRKQAQPSQQTQPVKLAQKQDNRLQVLIDDPYLGQFENDIKLRISKYHE